MALASFTLTNGEWKKISTAGYTGAAWFKSANGFMPKVVIAHTTEAQTYNPDDDPDLGVLDDNIPYASAVGLDIDIAYSLPISRSSDPLVPDSETDVFYATVLNTDKTCVIVADFSAE